MNVPENSIIHPLFQEELPDVVHGTVSSHGGVSPQPFATNNISFGVGDEHDNVNANREIIKKQFGLQRLVSAHQVHGENIHRVESPVEQDYIIDDTDALITDVKGVGLMIGHADCQAVLLHDAVHQAIGAVHSGWRGNVANILATTIEAMTEQFGSKPENLHVAIGPSLGPCCAEFVNFRRELPLTFRQYLVSENHFDFWAISRDQLRECGVPDTQISCVEICTTCSTDYFSYRRACRNGSGVTGRNGTLIALV